VRLVLLLLRTLVLVPMYAFTLSAPFHRANSCIGRLVCGPGIRIRIRIRICNRLCGGFSCFSIHNGWPEYVEHRRRSGVRRGAFTYLDPVKSVTDDNFRVLLRSLLPP
jgi:hypothetical protein